MFRKLLPHWCQCAVAGVFCVHVAAVANWQTISSHSHSHFHPDLGPFVTSSRRLATLLSNFLRFDARIFRCAAHSSINPLRPKWHFRCVYGDAQRDIYVFTIDTEFNKEKLVYLMRCAYTRDNLQCSFLPPSSTVLHEGLCLVDFVSLSMLEVT